VKKIILLSTVASSLVFASGYRLPENSINSVALSGAYVANTRGADSAYYNPANMVFNENINQVEGTLTYINLSEINYTDKQKPALNSHSEEENLFTPSLFYSSKDYNGLRYGFSMTVPGGLTKRWESPYGKAFSEEFTLKIIELNPSIAYKVNDNFAVGGGLRVIYSEGITKSDATALGKPVVRDMEADTIEYGYNLALTYKPVDEVKVSATYRSNIALTEEGNAKLYLSGTKLYDGGASVTVPLPAVAAVAISYDYGYTTVEVEYDRTMWSEYKELDFDFKDDIPRALKAAFDDPKPREWEDTDTIRLGITHHLNDKLTLMGGIATDGNPAPEKHIGFELPDSDAMLYSAGVNYKYSKTLSFGASILYDSKDERAVSQGRSLTNTTAIEGEFTDASATLVTVGANYKF
jgi:long-chain fatty acid transport protein